MKTRDPKYFFIERENSWQEVMKHLKEGDGIMYDRVPTFFLIGSIEKEKIVLGKKIDRGGHILDYYELYEVGKEKIGKPPEKSDFKRKLMHSSNNYDLYQKIFENIDKLTENEPEVIGAVA